jgi:hypothetical protein
MYLTATAMRNDYPGRPSVPVNYTPSTIARPPGSGKSVAFHNLNLLLSRRNFDQKRINKFSFDLVWNVAPHLHNAGFFPVQYNHSMFYNNTPPELVPAHNPSPPVTPKTPTSSKLSPPSPSNK